MRFLASLSLVCLALATSAFAQQTDDAIAQQFYPQQLRDDLRKFSDEDLPPIYKFVRGDLTGAGSKMLVVAYSNGRMGALRVIDVSGAPALLDENLDLSGTRPIVELFDLDRDGRMEIITAFAAMRTDITSIFKWTNGHLVLWGPTRTDQYGVVHSTLPTLDYADIDGDGLLELIEEKDIESGILLEKVYRLSGGNYVPAQPAAFHGEYMRASGEPENVKADFPAPDNGAGRWLLRVINGDDKGGNSVTSGDIRLNGATLVTSDMLKKKVRTITVPVTLRAINTIEVELRSATGTGLTVVLTKE
jgi:hypothetical protein